MTNRELFELALEVRARAYAPYSNYKVGAVVVDDKGRIFSGCNVENSSFGLTICAERNAVARAVAGGATQLVKLLLVAESHPVMPCGACLQVMKEFAPNMQVVCADTNGNMIEYQLNDLLPHAFKFNATGSI